MTLTSAETSVAFFAVSVALALAPGPDNLFVLVQSALHGRRAGLLVVLGLCTGLIAHTAAVAVGLAAVLAASQRAFDLLKYAGAAYLAVLAWQAFRAPPSAGMPGPRRAAGLRLYLRGIVMNVTNPKVAIFFLAFLPQFVEPRHGDSIAQIAWLGLLFILATLLAFGAIAWFAAALGAALRRSPQVEVALNRIAGCIYLALAARLALVQR